MSLKAAPAATKAATSNLHDGDATQTSERILDATFRTKDQLVIEVLDAVNQRLLARQAAMYASAGGFAQKWADARRFYEDDLASGFVRLQAELSAASLSNPGF